jgi:hypothetical protein
MKRPRQKVLPVPARRQVEKLGEPVEGDGLSRHPRPGDAFEREFRPGDEAGQAEPGDRCGEQAGILAAAAMLPRAVGAQQFEAEQMFAERAGAMMILAVHVVGDRAADRDVLRARADREEPAARHREREDVGEQHAGLAVQDAGTWIERDEAVEAARVQQRAAVVQAHVAVAAAVAVGEDTAVRVRQGRVAPV